MRTAKGGVSVRAYVETLAPQESRRRRNEGKSCGTHTSRRGRFSDCWSPGDLFSPSFLPALDCLVKVRSAAAAVLHCALLLVSGTVRAASRGEASEATRERVTSTPSSRTSSFLPIRVAVPLSLSLSLLSFENAPCTSASWRRNTDSVSVFELSGVAERLRVWKDCDVLSVGRHTH